MRPVHVVQFSWLTPNGNVTQYVTLPLGKFARDVGVGLDLESSRLGARGRVDETGVGFVAGAVVKRTT